MGLTGRRTTEEEEVGYKSDRSCVTEKITRGPNFPHTHTRAYVRARVQSYGYTGRQDPSLLSIIYSLTVFIGVSSTVRLPVSPARTPVVGLYGLQLNRFFFFSK